MEESYDFGKDALRAGFQTRQPTRSCVLRDQYSSKLLYINVRPRSQKKAEFPYMGQADGRNSVFIRKDAREYCIMTVLLCSFGLQCASDQLREAILKASTPQRRENYPV